jgi:hypothetical protein
MKNDHDAYRDMQKRMPYKAKDSMFTKGKNWMASDKEAVNGSVKFTIYYNEKLKVYALVSREDADESHWANVFIHVRSFMSQNDYTYDQSVLRSSSS